MVESEEQIESESPTDTEFLKGLLSHENPYATYYKTLTYIERNMWLRLGKRPPKDIFSSEWLMPLPFTKNRSIEYKEDIKYIEDKLNGHTLVDLGSGWGVMQVFARKSKAEAYIGVDAYLLEDETEFDLFKNVTCRQRPQVPRVTKDIMVQADMLEFVSRLRDDSVNFTINAIDSAIIYNSDYEECLAGEVIRATRKGGIVFGRFFPGLRLNIAHSDNPNIKHATSNFGVMNPDSFVIEKAK